MLCVGGRENETGRSENLLVSVFVRDCKESIPVTEEAERTLKKNNFFGNKKFFQKHATGIFSIKFVFKAIKMLLSCHVASLLLIIF